MSKNNIYAAIIVSSFSFNSLAHAGNTDNIERAGDIIQIAIPAIAYGSTFYMDDEEGRQQFYKSAATNFVATHSLKNIVDKKRPDGGDHAFPSGHTSMAFQGAGFIHKRYGLEYGIPAYLGAAFVGYSRVKSDRHDTTDVLAGAALGLVSSLYFTKSYNDDKLMITTDLSPEFYGISANYKF